MVDFLRISTRSVKRGVTEIYPKFIITKSDDLMIRGSDFYAVWIEDRNLWSTDEQDVVRMVDAELDKYAEENQSRIEGTVVIRHMWDSSSGAIDDWHRYCKHHLRDSFHMLDENLIFSNTEVKKTDYASKRLSYPLEPGKTDAYDKIMSTLYSPEERRKIEWAIGAIVSGDSKQIQKFMVLYGAAGTGKSTVLNIIQQLFDGYYSVFDAKSLGSSSNDFALEPFKTNPLVAIQHDGDLSRIEDNTRLNSLVSHEMMTVNEKFKSAYANRFKCFLFMGTNKPVKITDAKSGLIRRLIDVSPTGKKLDISEYRRAMSKIKFELGAIASHCLEVYKEDPGRYDTYIPLNMLGASNDFYNYILDAYGTFSDNGSTTLKAAWAMYLTYCDDAKVAYPYSQRIFKEELKNYFADFKERATLTDGTRVRNYYTGFLTEKFQVIDLADRPAPKQIEFKEQPSLLDDILADCPAQYANSKGTPLQKWSEVTTKLSSIDTHKLHYVKLPKHHIVIDFDIPDETGKKSLEKNIEYASRWPDTYAELSKSGSGVHLHYIYDGDVTRLSRVFDEHIEIKIFTGNSSLRRMLTKCNDKPIATINSGLPMKGEKMVNVEAIKSENGIRSLVRKNLRREVHPNTKPSIDFIYRILEDAYNNPALTYDISDMKSSIITFAAQSTHQADYCLKLVDKMHFKSEDKEHDILSEDDNALVFYDVEVFPNLFLVNWKYAGDGKTVVRMINPTSEEIEELLRYNLVGFNCRRYDNHILYGRLIGYSNEQLYKLSQKIISGKTDAFFGEAYNVSYTDVYDFCSKKQGLKKWEIELGIHHKELGLPWDQPVPEEMWVKVAEYCDNDVLATEAVFNARQADFTARKILAEIAGMTVNDTTNSLTARIIVGKNKHPQDVFNYRNLGTIESGENALPDYGEGWDSYTHFYQKDGKFFPVFPGYSYKNGKSVYRGEEVGEGGYVYAEPGIYTNVALLDIASMHPSSIIAENLFGDKYTAIFKEIVDSRLAIKHKDWDKAKTLLNGKLATYISRIEKGELSADDLAYALKIVINSVYGLTAANFDNPFRDIRNKDNIVAKRGALFMVNLKHLVQERGFTVAHIKTDSIKIPNATPEIIELVKEYGRLYGYSFEHEATYDRMCLVNDAVYIAKYKDGKHAGEWTATGTQFQVPYVFKRLFSHEPIVFDDMCETKSVSTALYLDMNENLPDVSRQEAEFEKLRKKRAGYLKENTEESTKKAEEIAAQMDSLKNDIEKGHNYIFVGRVGRFCPVKKGGELMRQTENKTTGETGYAAATGSKGYRWMESEMVSSLDKEADIDRTYYERLVNDAIEAISAYGDFEWFVSDDSGIDIPPWFSAGEPFGNETTPFDVR